MKRLTLLFIILLSALAFAEGPPRIAVYVTGSVSDDEKSALGTRMLAALVNSGRYMGIERSQAFLAKVDEEHVAQRSGAVDDGQISELGKQFGVKYVCVAAITPAYGAFQVSARIIDVETAQVSFIGEANSPLKTIKDLARVSDEVVMIMFGEVPARPALEEKRNVRIGIGAGGLFSGAWGGAITMPYTGGGVYVWLDAKYVQITAAYTSGGGPLDGFVEGNSGNPIYVDMPRSFMSIGVYGRYPEVILEVYEKIKLYPLAGIEYEMSAGIEFNSDASITPPNTNELNALWGKIGCGADFNLNADMHLRAEVMYGIRTNNAFDKTYSQTSYLGHGLIVRAGAGIRF